MVRHKLIIAAALLLRGCAPPESSVPTYELVVYVSEVVRGDDRAAAWDATYEFVVEGVPPGTWVHVLSAPSGRLVGSWRVAAGDRFDRIADSNSREAIANIKAFFDDPNPGYTGQLDIPAWGAKLAEIKQTDLPWRIVAFGTPLYLDERYAGHSMRYNLAPHDGNLLAEEAPFGSGVTALPPGAMVRIVTRDDAWGDSRRHREAVVRWWRLFFLHHGQAELVGVGPHAAKAFDFSRSQFVDDVAIRNDQSGCFAVQTGSEGSVIAPKPPEFGDETVARLLESAQENKDVIVFAALHRGEEKGPHFELRVASPGGGDELSRTNHLTPFGEFYDASYHSRPDGKDRFTDVAAVRIDHDRAHEVEVWLRSFNPDQGVRLRVAAVWRGRKKEGFVMIDPPNGLGDERIEANGWRRISLHGGPQKAALSGVAAD